MKQLISILTLLLAAGAAPLAADGRIPLYQPTAITEPGSYVVTRDIEASATIFTINADGVEIDLNGFTLRVDVTTADVIRIDISGSRVTGTEIRGGRIEGGGSGILCSAGAPPRLRVRDMVIAGVDREGVACTFADEVVVERVEIHDAQTGIYLSSLTALHAVVRDSVIRDVDGWGVAIVRASGSVVEGNRISGFGSTTSTGLAAIEVAQGLTGSEGRGNRIVDNVIEGGVGAAHGIASTGGVGTLIDRNLIDAADGYGILVSGSHFRVTRNVVTGSTLSGIYVIGPDGWLGDNSSQGNGNWGVGCFGGTFHYRGNLLLPNAFGSIDTVADCAASTDLGDNVR